ncbi:acyl-CoA ligase (AMP-forming), exosortase A system-associated [Streptomyces sp. YIM 98790]|uniref:acyl-CoA ligase (AMP-forming), exosortase A system-associated n=1 Tax=Streptomyces sp. YIM 98790 TaxID=2689077 RepID=UPI00140DAAE8|nr:acyl-CoA ligase (AMP-forming), exosortase A system-associated [Streptomyces sp. YIM 98790]
MCEQPPRRLDQLTACGEPGRPAVTFRSETLTYRELADRVSRVAHGLHGLGVRRGDRVAVWAEKRIETVVALLAVAAAGGVLVPLNPVYRSRQVRHVLADCAPRVVLTTEERRAGVLGALAPESSVAHVVSFGSAGWHALEGTEPPFPGAPVPGAGDVIDDDVAAILYTSGSTGRPKGVVLSHRNLLAGAASVAGYLGHTRDDVVLAVLPLSFDAGFSQLTTALVAGAHVVLVNYLRAREVVRLCARHRVTGLTCVPPLWLQLAEQDWPAESTAALRYFANTGGRMPRTTLAALRDIFPAADPYLMYGLTEAFRSTYLDPAEAGRRPDSIGRAVPNAEVLVVRPDGTPCAPGEHGELVHRGALVALGYWNDPERTAQRFRPAPGRPPTGRPEIAVWSGDTVYRDEEGFLYFVGRDDEMIKTSGYRVSPTEIEEAAYATGLAAEAVAFGVEDPRLGSHIVLAARPADAAGASAENLSRALARELPAYMMPRRIELLPRLPRTANGKFDRVGLRETLRRAAPPAPPDPSARPAEPAPPAGHPEHTQKAEEELPC